MCQATISWPQDDCHGYGAKRGFWGREVLLLDHAVHIIRLQQPAPMQVGPLNQPGRLQTPQEGARQRTGIWRSEVLAGEEGWMDRLPNPA